MALHDGYKSQYFRSEVVSITRSGSLFHPPSLTPSLQSLVGDVRLVTLAVVAIVSCLARRASD
jgi:hypothetical protein